MGNILGFIGLICVVVLIAFGGVFLLEIWGVFLTVVGAIFAGLF